MNSYVRFLCSSVQLSNSARTRMSIELRRSPRLLQQKLAEANAFGTPKRSSNVSRRQIELTAEERSCEWSRMKSREDLVDSVVKAFTADCALTGLLNVTVYEHGSDDLEATTEGWWWL